MNSNLRPTRAFRTRFWNEYNSYSAFAGFALRGGFSGGFTLSTSAITSLNGSGMCGIGLEFLVMRLVGTHGFVKCIIPTMFHQLKKIAIA
jgi:hypothetical protein